MKKDFFIQAIYDDIPQRQYTICDMAFIRGIDKPRDIVRAAIFVFDFQERDIYYAIDYEFLCRYTSTEIMTLHYKNQAKGEIYLSESRKWKEKDLTTLSECQKTILILAQQGKTRKQIADILAKSVHTIDRDIEKFFIDFDCKNIAQAIVFAANRNLIYGNIVLKEQDTCARKPPPKKDKERSPFDGDNIGAYTSWIGKWAKRQRAGRRSGFFRKSHSQCYQTGKTDKETTSNQRTFGLITTISHT